MCWELLSYCLVHTDSKILTIPSSSLLYTVPSHSGLSTPLNITWHYPPGTQVTRLQDNAQLRVLVAQFEDAGTYTCVVTGLGERSATLTVRGERNLVHTLLPPGLMFLYVSVSPYSGIPSITFSLPPSLPYRKPSDNSVPPS